MEIEDRQRSIDVQAEARKAWVAQQKAWKTAYARLEAEGVPVGQMAGRLPVFDCSLFVGLVCGARSRQTGQPCRLTVLCAGGRCRYHGGRSTGPRSAEGKAKVTANLRHQVVA